MFIVQGQKTYRKKQKGRLLSHPLAAACRPGLPALCLLQTSNIVSHGFHLFVGEPLAYRSHLRAIGTRAGAEIGQLGNGVILMLTGDAGKLCRNTGAVRAMTSCTGWHILFSDAGTIDFFAELDCIFVARRAGRRFLLIQIGGEVADVIVIQRLGDPGHDGIVAVWALKVIELLLEVGSMLTGQLWVLRNRRITCGAMTCNASENAALCIAVGVEIATLDRV